jgi:hypothetical protein
MAGCDTRYALFQLAFGPNLPSRSQPWLYMRSLLRFGPCQRSF